MRSLVFAFVMVVGCGGGGGSEKSCETSPQCSTEAPYCSGEACSATCSGDTDCPGFGQSAADKFCTSGNCVACRVDMPADCTADKPICGDGECRRCERNSECASGACATDGSCVAETSIVYVSPGGGTAGCTRAEPCTLTAGIALTPPRQFIVLLPGTHAVPASLSVAGTRSLIGSGTPRPIITNNSTGPIINLALGANVTFDHVQLSGAKNNVTGGSTGAAILCPDGTTMSMPVTVKLFDVLVTQNAASGIDARKCTVDVRESVFTNTGRAVSVVDTNAKVDRSSFTGNSTALFLDAGVFTITNNFVFRNQEGIDLFSNAGTIVEHNTIADNSTFGMSCQAFDMPQQFSNNLFARNTVNTPTSSSCSYPNSITAGTDIGPIKFKSPDAAPFDYHIQTGSSAIDLGSTSTVMSDFDGETRPFGAGPDIGADEFH
jgi:parallel beta-helix repeat protein